jgi:hypothetical protein
MARVTKVDRLPAELKSLIGQLRQEGHTLDEIFAKLRELKPDIDISRTGLGEHLQKKVDAILDQMGKTRAIAQAVGARIDSASQTEVARLNVELLHGLFFKLVSESEDGEDVKIDAKEALLLSRALQSLTSSSKSLADMEIKIRREIAEKASKVAETSMKAAGISSDTVAKIRAEILGVAK